VRFLAGRARRAAGGAALDHGDPDQERAGPPLPPPTEEPSCDYMGHAVPGTARDTEGRGAHRPPHRRDPTPEAEELAGRTGRDARVCQLYLDESAAITEVRGRHVVTVHRLGFTGTGPG
jgi:hypothetical protein